jgi:hypothetical protein
LFVEAEAFVCEQEFGVRPCAPFGAVDVVAEGLFLVVCNEGEEGLGGVDDGVDVYFFVFVGEEAFSDGACGYRVRLESEEGLGLTNHRW